MMGMLANNRNKQSIGEVIDQLDETGFVEMLGEITDESQRFLQTTALANDAAFKSMLEQGLFAFTRKLGQLLNADRSSLFTVENESASLWLRITEHLPDEEIHIPIGSGIAGAVAANGESIRLDDAYSDSRFNPSVDKELGYRTRSILCLPVKNRAGSVFAVAQLLNRKDGRPFDDEDEEKYKSFLDSIGLILETLEELLVKH